MPHRVLQHFIWVFIVYKVLVSGLQDICTKCLQRIKFATYLIVGMGAIGSSKTINKYTQISYVLHHEFTRITDIIRVKNVKHFLVLYFCYTMAFHVTDTSCHCDTFISFDTRFYNIQPSRGLM